MINPRLLLFGAFLLGFLISTILFFGLLAPQPFDAYFDSEQINFWSFDDFRLACDSIAGEIQCGPECTCSFKSKREMIDAIYKASEIVEECIDKAIVKECVEQEMIKID